mmetsp:Transcript_22251/g.63499  ORF Transcript_22251/g.63499 Transcript_22251/m.63499 type:complete len:84 (+) Transcript_22251:855-1106(+)
MDTIDHTPHTTRAHESDRQASKGETHQRPTRQRKPLPDAFKTGAGWSAGRVCVFVSLCLCLLVPLSEGSLGVVVCIGWVPLDG